VDILNRDNVSVKPAAFYGALAFPGDDTLKVLEKSKKSYVVESKLRAACPVIRQETGKGNRYHPEV